MIAAHYLSGAWYPEHGAGQLAQQIIPTIKATGGDCLTGRRVTKLLTQSGAVCGVQTAKGEEYFAPVVISNIGAYETYKHL